MLQGILGTAAEIGQHLPLVLKVVQVLVGNHHVDVCRCLYPSHHVGRGFHGLLLIDSAAQVGLGGCEGVGIVLPAFLSRGKLGILHAFFLLLDLGYQLLHLFLHLTGFLRFAGSFVVLFQVVQFRDIGLRGFAKEFFVDVESTQFVADGVLMEIVEMACLGHVDENHGHVVVAFVERFVDVEGFPDQGQGSLIVFLRVQVEGFVV